MNQVIVSVIVTAYNQADTIAQTLESVLRQEGNLAAEIIVADDGSTDLTRAIAERYQRQYPERIRLLFQAQNLGVGGNWASAVQLARGKYIATCAADDYWHLPTKLQEQVAYLEAHPDCGLLYTDYHVLHTDTGTITSDYLTQNGTTIYTGTNLTQAIFGGRAPILTATTLFRRDLADRYLPYGDYIRNRFPLEDWPSWLILSMYTAIGYLPVATATYRRGHDSISNPLTFQRAEEKFRREADMYRYLCERYPEQLTYDAAGYRVYAYQNLLRLALRNHNFRQGRQYAIRLRQEGIRSLLVRLAAYKIPFHLTARARSFYGKLKAH